MKADNMNSDQTVPKVAFLFWLHTVCNEQKQIFELVLQYFSHVGMGLLATPQSRVKHSTTEPLPSITLR